MKKLVSILSILGLFTVAAAQAAGTSQQLVVEGMTCSSCAKSIKAAFSKLPEVKAVEVNVEKGTVMLELHPEKTLTEQQIRDAVTAAGYKVTKVSSAKSS
jgi:Cu+-exporting ATPase